MPASAHPTCCFCKQPVIGLTARLDPRDPSSVVAINHPDCYLQLMTALMIQEATARDLATRAAS